MIFCVEDQFIYRDEKVDESDINPLVKKLCSEKAILNGQPKFSFHVCFHSIFDQEDYDANGDKTKVIVLDRFIKL